MPAGECESLEITNQTNRELEVSVEIALDRYLLRPQDRMVIAADLRGAPFTVNVYRESVQVYPGNSGDPVVTINGRIARSVPWEQPDNQMLETFRATPPRLQLPPMIP